MFKKLFTLMVVLAFCGCAYEGSNTIRSVIEDPPSLIKDPHYATYQKNLDDLESQYLRKEITYAEYVKQKDKLDQDYNWQVDQRESITASREIQPGR